MSLKTSNLIISYNQESFDSETGATLYLDSERVRFEPELTGAAALSRCTES